jgi:hypothetical protein
MKPEFSGIEKRLDELNERLARLEALKAKSRSEFDADPYLRDIVERNLEVAAQCCLDICHRIISIEKAVKPGDYHEAFLRMSEAPRAAARGICGEAKRNSAEANPPSPFGLRRGRLSPFLPVLPHGASWRRRVNWECSRPSSLGNLRPSLVSEISWSTSIWALTGMRCIQICRKSMTW